MTRARMSLPGIQAGTGVRVRCARAQANAVLEFSVAFGKAVTPHRETVALRREGAGVGRPAGYAVRAC